MKRVKINRSCKEIVIGHLRNAKVSYLIWYAIRDAITNNDEIVSGVWLPIFDVIQDALRR